MVSTCMQTPLVGGARASKRANRYLSSRVIKGHQWQSRVISGNPGSSVAIKGHQWQSRVIKGHQGQSRVISGNQGSSVAIQGLQRALPLLCTEAASPLRSSNTSRGSSTSASASFQNETAASSSVHRRT